MSRKKSLSKRLSRRDLDDAEFDEALEEFHAGSDRVTAIMGTAMVEEALRRAIASALHDDRETSALFHEEGSPFGSFRARIMAGRALGLYDQKTADDLNIVRDVRNQFAHALLKLDFANEHIVNACADLSDRRQWDLPERAIGETRLKFENTCLSLAFLLMRKTNKNLKSRADTMKATIAGLIASDPLNTFALSSLQGGIKNLLNEEPPGLR